MNIINILTKTNVKIIKMIDRENLHLRDIADKLKVSPGSVHKLVSILKKEKIVKETTHKNRINISLDRNNPIARELKEVINFNDIINSPAYKKLKKTGNTGFYGSYANGTNDNNSDLDLWVKTEKKEIEIRPVIRELENQLNVKINPLLLTKSKIESLKKHDPEFHIRLRLTSKGDSLD